MLYLSPGVALVLFCKSEYYCDTLFCNLGVGSYMRVNRQCGFICIAITRPLFHAGDGDYPKMSNFSLHDMISQNPDHSVLGLLYTSSGVASG